MLFSYTNFRLTINFLCFYLLLCLCGRALARLSFRVARIENTDARIIIPAPIKAKIHQLSLRYFHESMLPLPGFIGFTGSTGEGGVGLTGSTGDGV